MPQACFAAPTLDDLMRSVVEEIHNHGAPIHPTRGRARELHGALLEITNPRARLSRTETRGKPYSCLGELCWYLAKTRNVRFIEYYIRQYREYADGNHVYGGYGPRLFNWKGTNQVENVISLLKRKPHSRQAVIQLFDAADLIEEHRDTPCTCTLQFLMRKNRLHMFTTMHSNDVYLGLPHDIFCFTMLQELVARSLSVELGTYKHAVGSLHLYEDSAPAAQRFLNEGWQPTTIAMPPMPEGDPWPAVSKMLASESSIRTEGTDLVPDIDPYWADLVRLLIVFRAKKYRDFERVRSMRGQMSCSVYNAFIDKMLG